MQILPQLAAITQISQKVLFLFECKREEEENYNLESIISYPDHNHVGFQQNFCKRRFQNIQADIGHLKKKKKKKGIDQKFVQFTFICLFHNKLNSLLLQQICFQNLFQFSMQFIHTLNPVACSQKYPPVNFTTVAL